MKNANAIEHEARKILSEFAEHFPELKGLPIRISSRMTRTAGKAVWHYGKPFEIVLSLPFFADKNNNLRNTVAHEAAHIVAGPREGHGPWWQAIHRSLGGTGQRYHTMSLAEGFSPRKRKPKVEAICPKCNNTMLLGPMQAKKAARGFVYRHKRCASS